MSTTQEFYVRKTDEADARGPFNIEQLVSLAENGQVDLETFYYDAAAEVWTPISANPELVSLVFPAKKSLKVKAKTDAQVRTLNTVSEEDRPITVNDMLLAAEGRTEDTKDKADPAIAQARAAGLGLYAALAILVLLSAAFVLPHVDLVYTANIEGLLLAPISVLGLLCLGLAVCLGLGSVASYPVVRFAAMLTIGLGGTFFYLQGLAMPMTASVLAGIGLYLCTVIISLPAIIAVGATGLVGACGLAYHLFTT